jgi:enoyl-CoA hydratase
MGTFAEQIETAHDDPELNALIITGKGGAFCAGGDLYELDNYPSYQDGVRLSNIMSDALKRLVELPSPTIAAIEGPAMGGGAEIALACDLRVMAESATLGLMHVRLAICTAWGGGQRLLRLVGYARALAWLAAGRILNASESLACHLATCLTPDGHALSEAKRMAKDFAQNDRAAVRAIKRFLRAGVSLSPDQATAAEKRAFPYLWASPAHLEASKRFISRKKRRVA